jgi:hypothetical protein
LLAIGGSSCCGPKLASFEAAGLGLAQHRRLQ